MAPLLVTGFAQAQTTERVSVGVGGVQGAFSAVGASISADGRFVAFASISDNLVAGDTNGWADVFVRDRRTGTTERVSLGNGGSQAEYGGSSPSISADGRYVAFTSDSRDLVAGDTNHIQDVFVHDRQSSTTVRVSVDSGGAQAIDFGCSFPSISADGRCVAFYSSATNLVPGDTNGSPDIFLRDLQAATTERVSVGPGGVQGSGFVTFYSSISADGRFVAFDSSSAFVGTGDHGGWIDVFVRDRQLGTTERVSVGLPGLVEDYHSGASSMSADGRFVAFVSRASNLVLGDTNTFHDCFVRDRSTGTTERVSVATSGAQGNGLSSVPRISANGRFVAFHSSATNFAELDVNGRLDVFVRDREGGVTQLVSVSTGGVQGALDSDEAHVSADGRFVTFESFNPNLVAGDTNNTGDVFVHDQRGTQPPTSFCSGDGSATACPCGPGAPGRGCPSSVSARGARLDASGASALVADTLVLAGTGMPNGTALYFQGTAGSAVGALLGDGLRCVEGATVRLGTKTNAAGASRYPEAGDLAVSARGQITEPGTRTYQVWYRNAASYCTPATFNLTNGSTVRWTLF